MATRHCCWRPRPRCCLLLPLSACDTCHFVLKGRNAPLVISDHEVGMGDRVNYIVGHIHAGASAPERIANPLLCRLQWRRHRQQLLLQLRDFLGAVFDQGPDPRTLSRKAPKPIIVSDKLGSVALDLVASGNLVAVGYRNCFVPLMYVGFDTHYLRPFVI